MAEADDVVVLGGGPAGLFAAEILAMAGRPVTLYEAMPSVGRKLLMAGRGGLNLTHAEAFEPFVARYGDAATLFSPLLAGFGPDDLRAWAEGLGIETFIGSSGRVFPRMMKASPLLRAWLARLDRLGVVIRTRHRWTGFTEDGALIVEPDGAAPVILRPRAAIMALGGASWPRLGATGAWVAPLAAAGADITPLRPANAGFPVDWSPGFAARWAGTPLKTIALHAEGARIAGEAMITRQGLEGGVIYAAGAALRRRIEAEGAAIIALDLKPGLSEGALARRLVQPRRGASTTNFLRKATGLAPVGIALLRESPSPPPPDDPMALARRIKRCEIRLVGQADLSRAISTAGGVAFGALDAHFMLRAHPGLFLAGEMLDWEAPTGGYLLQGCFSTARHAADGLLRWLHVSPLASRQS
jgi:uncharacterized flavoprotein (TIGR03862 family)